MHSNDMLTMTEQTALHRVGTIFGHPGPQDISINPNLKDAVVSSTTMSSANLSAARGSDFDESFDEEVDEEFTDEEEETFSDEDLERALNATEQKNNDATQKLLNFAEMVNKDIQKFFGQKKDVEDACDIYQDKWTSGKSGRELYYADLLKIAHGYDSEDNPKPSKKSKRSSSNDFVELQSSKGSEQEFTGKMDKKIGMGPLNELFEYGLRNFLTDKNVLNSHEKLKRIKFDVKKFEHVVPMNDRQLPESFWKEPGSVPKNNNKTGNGLSNGLLPGSKLPDFGDLIDNWMGVEDRECEAEKSERDEQEPVIG
ncbi:uncharacterized protein LOC106152765 [Lingula anatina]|uniref:Uncharacterized protein LOC106152765 n=1 Tax=Lingula anatina TaxID=7574 RepID=A0A1S3H9Z2_LINAN|nr:uncharacterized protein LOC106152765 [Lingula anatina]XP_013381940.1 uncharacterized protein LOC106152765 [Lingula anatina]|eukprot:XP_013381939.1 uncharacterized protein LOC106152765 [Lingula anatina]